jgi:hypothetical protein
MYTRALVHAYANKSWRKLANVQRILLHAAETLILGPHTSRNVYINKNYMLIPDVYARYQATPERDVTTNIFGLTRDALQARYPDTTVRTEAGGWTASTYRGNNPLVLISRRSGRVANITWIDIAKYLVDVVSRQNRTVHKDFDYLLKHNMVFLPEVLIELGTMHRERRITTNTFEAVQNILKRGITDNRKVQSECVEQYVSQIALHFEMKTIMKNINMRPLFVDMFRLLTDTANSEYYRVLLYPGRRLTQESFEFFKWLFQYIPISDKPRLVKIIVRLSGRIQPPYPITESNQLLTNFIKWAVKIAGDDHVQTLFSEIIDFAKNADPGTMYSDQEQMVGILKYLRTIVFRRGTWHNKPQILATMFTNKVKNIAESSPRAWIKHVVDPKGSKSKSKPNHISKLNPKKLKELRQQTLLHPSVNGEDVVTMERVPLNKAVTLRGHDVNGKIRYIFNRTTAQNLMKDHRWYNHEGVYTPTNRGRGENPFTRQSFSRQNVVPLNSRLGEHDRQLYNMLLHKNNAGGNKHAKINSVFNHLEKQQEAERKKKATNKKRKRNAQTNKTPNNNKGKKAKSTSRSTNRSSLINLTKTNNTATSKRGSNEAGPSRPKPSPMPYWWG